MRAEFCRGLEFAGVRLDGAKNEAVGRGAAADVSVAGSPVKVWGGALHVGGPRPSRACACLLLLGMLGDTCRCCFLPGEPQRPCAHKHARLTRCVHWRGLLLRHPCMPHHHHHHHHPTRTPPSPPPPATQVLVIPTDEELSIAQQTLEVIDHARGVAARA